MAVDLQPWKGQGVTLRAFAALAASSRTSAASSRGASCAAPRGATSASQELVRAQGLAGRAYFLGARKDVADVLSALDVAIPSRSGAS